MLGPSAEESEMLVTEHLHYLERLAKFSLDLNMYNIPIVQETFQKLVSITGTRRFFQRAEAFERFLSMLSRRTLNSNYYLNRQYYEDVNAYNNNAYGHVNIDHDYVRRVQAINAENVNYAYYRDYNRRILNENMLSINNINRYYRQPYFNQRDITPNNNLDDIEEEEEEEEEIDQDESIEQEDNINNLSSFNSENSSPSTTSLREEYSIYAPSAHYRRHRSRAPSYENYMNRIRHPNFQRVQSSISEISNTVSTNTNNPDTKTNDNIYPENNSETNNTISEMRTFDNNTNISLNTTNNNNNNSNNNIENIHPDTINESLQMNKELKYNTPSYRNINMKLYEDLNILTPPATEDDIHIKEEKDTKDEKINTNNNQDININNSESQSIIIIPTVELGSIDQKLYSNIPKEEIINSDDSSNNNTINKKPENSLNIKRDDYQTESIYKNDNTESENACYEQEESYNNNNVNSSSSSYSNITIRNSNYDTYLLNRKRKYESQTTSMSFPQQKKLKQ